MGFAWLTSVTGSDKIDYLGVARPPPTPFDLVQDDAGDQTEDVDPVDCTPSKIEKEE